MSVACVLVTHLPVKLELLRRPSLRGRPLLVVKPSTSRKAVLDRSPEAKVIVAGMALEHALARCPSATIIEADLPAYHDAWSGTLDALEQRSPVVEDADLGLAYVDLRGLHRLYGDENTLLRAIINAVPQVYRPRVGVAQGKFSAFVAALHAESGRAYRAPADVASFLASFPVKVLPTDWQVKERLMGFGLETIGSVAGLPFSAMQGEFGREGARLWHLANGQDSSPVLPRPHEETVDLDTSFATPTASLPTILVALENLLARAFSSPKLRGRYARIAALYGQVLNGAPWTRRLVFREPIGNATRAGVLFRHSLENLALPGPLETISLTLSGLTGEAGRQESLFSDIRRQEQLDEEVRQLEARLGQRPPIFRIREVEPWSRIPERRVALVPYAP